MTITSITVEDFYKRLKEHRFGDTQISIDFEVVINGSIVTWHHIVIKEVVFKERVIVRDCEINSGMNFTGCKFEKGIVFHNVKSTNYSSTYNSNNESVCFDNSEAAAIDFENNCFLDRSLTIKNDCKIDRLNITNLENRNAGIIIKNSSINYLQIVRTKSQIHFSKSIFQNSTRLETIFGDVSFVKNEFVKEIMIWNLECPNNFTLNYNLFKDNFEIEASRVNALTFIGDAFEKKGKFENRNLSPGATIETYLNKLYISEATFNEGFDLYGLGKGLNELKIVMSPELKGVLNVDNWIIEETIISGINQNLKLLLKNIKFRFLLINDFTNFNDISFDRCKGNGGEAILNLINSDMGSTRFNEFDLKSFQVLRLNNVSIDKIRPSNVNWFEDNQVEIEVHEQTESEKAKRKREIYRQLKQALKNNGNQIDSLIFQARELKCLRDEFKNSKNYKCGERLIMTVSQTNDYGLNWLKPVGIVLLGTLIFYLIILPSFSDTIGYTIAKDCSDLNNTWDSFINNSKLFWQLFNPIRQVKLTYGENVENGWIYFLDLLHRIFLGIMFFQIIKAFRKYVSD